MSTFDRFRRTVNDSYDTESVEKVEEKEPVRIREDGIDNDAEFEFDVPQEAGPTVAIEDAEETPYEVGRMNITRIGEDTLVTGNIETKGHIDVLGTIKGNIVAEGNVALRSDIKGNIRGNNIGLGSCNITGDIEAEKNILTESDSVINGNVKGGEISLAGRLNGDVKAGKMIILKKDAVMEGDIETDGLVVEPGAILNGKISITRRTPPITPPPRSYEASIEEPQAPSRSNRSDEEVIVVEEEIIDI